MKIDTKLQLIRTFTESYKIFSLSVSLLVLFSTIAYAQPSFPTIASPDSGAVNLPHNLMLIWSTSETAEAYRLQISKSSDFSSTVYDQSQLPSNAQFIDELDFSTIYYWRVTASNGSGTSDFSKVASFTTWSEVPNGPAPVDLGLLDTFAIIAYSAVTNVPSSAITGNVGLTPTTGSFIDLTETEVTGSIFTVDASGPAGSIASAVMLTEAKGDLTIAYNDAAGRTLAPVGIAGNIGGQTLYPSLYKSTGTLEISAGDLTLDANGNQDAVWIFQIASSFNMSSDRKIFLINGAQAANVYWQVGSAATFGTTTVMKGTVMAGTQLTFATGATLEGRALALTENVTLQQNTITVPEVIATSIDDEENAIPSKISLSQNYPNPFNPTTTIRFGISEAADVRLDVFNMLGQRVATLVNEPKAAGWHTIGFDATTLPTGIYMYQIMTNSSRQVKKMTLIK